MIDGLVLTGGSDVSPQFYQEEPEDCHDCNPVRDKWELELFKQAFKKQIPVLGICRGMQLMNVALGGSLYQDINKHLGEDLVHEPQGKDYVNHDVEIKKGSILYDIFEAEKIEVNSYHHQAIKEMAPPFSAIASSSGGIIEGIEAEDRKFVLGVQWHPEDLINKQPSFSKIFDMLVKFSKK